jgi:hypothetical protein
MLNKETPLTVINKMIDELELDSKEYPILEPSGGKGAILDELRKRGFKTTYCYELNEENMKVLHEKKHQFLGRDFLATTTLYPEFPRIIMVPPYKDNVDCEHIMKAYNFHLQDNGILVSLTLPHWITGINKNQINFRSWLSTTDHKLIVLNENVYREGIFSVPYILLKIKKPKL